MEPAQLQLVFNVIGITAVSSLASICYILRQENRKLARQLQPEQPKPVVSVPPAPMPAAPIHAAVVSPESRTDIRDLAADRRAGWVQGLTSAIS